MTDQLDHVLQTGIDRGAAPGVTAIVVDRDGVRYEGAVGERAIGSGVAMTTDTVGAIFSMTKALTGAAAMQLVEQGTLSLDAPASNVCPPLGRLQVLEGFDPKGQPVMRKPKGIITLRNLLTHTSGLVYDIWNADVDRWYEATGTPPLSEMKKESLNAALAFDSGTQWEYGIGIDWVGLMIEAASGLTLGDCFAARLTGPLGMIDTAFVHTPTMLERAATIHARLPGGSLAPIEVPGPENPEFESGGGAIHGTMTDYGRFLRMILNDGEHEGTQLLRPETVRQMATNQMGDLRVKKLVSTNAALSNDAEFFPGDPKSWGLTFQINEVAGPSGRPAGTLMWAGLANSFFWIDRANGIAGAYMSQILPFADNATLSLFNNFETAVYDFLV